MLIYSSCQVQDTLLISKNFQLMTLEWITLELIILELIT